VPLSAFFKEAANLPNLPPFLVENELKRQGGMTCACAPERDGGAG
jgi:hypothetical protein